MKNKQVIPILIALAAGLPGLGLWLAGAHLSAPIAVAISGAAIVAASFLLLWTCDAAQSEISQALAVAAVALVAVLPEYAVDMYFTWQAGKSPESNYASFATANMTGANRLLIGIAWSLIVALYWVRHRRDVVIEKERRTELIFLGLATVYAFVIPLKGSLAWYDGLVFLGIYVSYIVLAARRPSAEGEAEGTARLITRLPRAKRRLAIAGLFLFAGLVIWANSAPFCEGLIATGRAFHINEFLLVQWLAPVASEAPEFIVALMFAWRGQAGLALGSLLSAKLNQWTLLVGMIPGVFAVAHGSLAHPIPMNHLQLSEVLLTAAQSLLGVVLLAGLRLSIGGALLLFGLFIGQFILPLCSQWFPGLAFGLGGAQIHPVFTVIYVAVATALFLQNPSYVARLREGFQATGGSCGTFSGNEDEVPLSPQCETCAFRHAAQSIAADRPFSQRHVSGNSHGM
jgi:cation:H+ antiporter